MGRIVGVAIPIGIATLVPGIHPGYNGEAPSIGKSQAARFEPGSSPVSSLFGCVSSRWPTAAAGCGPIEAGIPSVDGTNDASIQRPADEVVSSGYSWVPRYYMEACGKPSCHVIHTSKELEDSRRQLVFAPDSRHGHPPWNNSVVFVFVLDINTTCTVCEPLIASTPCKVIIRMHNLAAVSCARPVHGPSMLRRRHNKPKAKRHEMYVCLQCTRLLPRHMSSFASAGAPSSHSLHSPYHARRRHVGFFGLCESDGGVVDVGSTGGSVMVARSPCVGSLIMVDVLSWHPQITPGVRHVVLSLLSEVELVGSSAHP